MFLKILQNSLENTCQSLFLKKVAVLRPTTLLKKRLWHSCFPVHFEKFLRTPICQNSSGWLLLFIVKTKNLIIVLRKIHKTLGKIANVMYFLIIPKYSLFSSWGMLRVCFSPKENAVFFTITEAISGNCRLNSDLL